jgi:cytochrome c-type biogenesis protein CcmH/NrfF
VIAALLGAVALFAWPAGHFVRETPSGDASIVAQIVQRPDSVLEARVRAVASELRCPVCQGESIQDSPAALAQEMRSIVREQLAAGRTPDEIKAYFVDKYGEWILLRPKARGWNMLVYVLPLVVLLGGAVVIARATRRWTATGDTKAQREIERETAET